MEKKINKIIEKYGLKECEYTVASNVVKRGMNDFLKTALIWFPVIIITAILSIIISFNIECNSDFLSDIMLIIFCIEWKIVANIVFQKELEKNILVLTVDGKKTYLYNISDGKKYEVNDLNIKNVIFSDVYDKENSKKNGFERLKSHSVKINFKDGTTLEIGFPSNSKELGIDENYVNDKCVDDFFYNIKEFELNWNVQK